MIVHWQGRTIPPRDRVELDEHLAQFSPDTAAWLRQAVMEMVEGGVSIETAWCRAIAAFLEGVGDDPA